MIIKKSISGFSLFEVLIALLVLSIGLLGLANLQGRSITSSYNAHLRTQATSLAQSMVDRMRANRDYAMNAVNNYQTGFSSSPPNAADCASSDCSESAMALYDLQEWKCNLGKFVNDTNCAGLVAQSTLPNGEGSISAPDAVTGQTTVTVQWTDTDGTLHRVRMFTSL